jgi:hypothetical protein
MTNIVGTEPLSGNAHSMHLNKSIHLLLRQQVNIPHFIAAYLRSHHLT